jgi:hypothetical protein
MVTSSVNGPTYRVGVFLDSILKPVSVKYCTGELVRDTTDFLAKLETLKDGNIIRPGDNLVALDICALYPNIRIDLALEAVQDALNKCTDYSSEQINMLLQLTRYALENSVVHYRGMWYKSIEGAPTGGPEVPAVANIHVKYVIDEKLLNDRRVMKINKLMNRSRFLDDIWGRWMGTQRTFETFKSLINEIGAQHGITFTGECGKSVVFLDVIVTNTAGGLETTMFVKPTDSVRYLHRRSGHSQHTFSGIPYSQYRRAVGICSSEEEKLRCIDRMEKKFLDSGYGAEDLVKAKERVMLLNRSSMLLQSSDNTDTNGPTPEIMAFVINQHPGLRKELQNFFSEVGEELKQIVGDVRFVISERKHSSTAALLFAKSSFSKLKPVVQESQKCGGTRCDSCVTMTLPRNIQINKLSFKLDYCLNCNTESAIYLARCKNCTDPIDKNSNFYFGRTVTAVRTRLNGHREKFKMDRFDKSALSHHTFEKHFLKFNDKLLNYDIGIIKSVSPQSLDRTEDFYIFETEADTKGLNRYKVAK